MSDYIEVIPDYASRPAFARWSLSQQPGGLTMTSHEAWAVPATLFADVPAALLEGAYIDGHVFRPALAGFEPDGDGYRPTSPAPADAHNAPTPSDVVPVDDGAQPEAVAAPVKKTAARRTRKAAL